MVVLPNSVLAKLGITNVSTPDETHGLSIIVRVTPTRTPAAVADIMRSVLQSADLILREPPPVVAIRGIDATAIELGLIFRVSEVGKRLPAMNEVYDLVYRHVRATGLLLAAPQSTLISIADLSSSPAARPVSNAPIDLVAALPVFAGLEADELQTLAAAIVVRTFASGDVIAGVGEVLPSLMIVRSGAVERQRGAPNARHETLSNLAPGDILGAGGVLFGRGEDALLRAKGRVTIYAIERHSLASILSAHPELVDDLATCLPSEFPLPDEAASSRVPTVAAAGLLGKIRTAMRA